MKTLFPALRISDVNASLAFYDAVGYEVVVQVYVDAGLRLVMLALPGEEEVSLELVHRPDHGPVYPGGLVPLAVQVDDRDRVRADLVSAGLEPDEIAAPGGPFGPRTVQVTDPDGHHLELVQWPPGHPTGMPRNDFDRARPDISPKTDGVSR